MPLYSTSGVRTGVTIYQKQCSQCEAVHYLSYASGGSHLEPGQQQFYPGATDARFFHLTHSALWERGVLVNYEAQALFSYTGFLTFINEYRMKYGTLPTTADRARKALAHGFYGWTLLRWRAEVDLPAVPMALGDANGREGLLTMTRAIASVSDDTLQKTYVFSPRALARIRIRVFAGAPQFQFFFQHAAPLLGPSPVLRIRDLRSVLLQAQAGRI